MRNILVLVFGLLVTLAARTGSQPRVYPDRWVYVSTGLANEQDLAQVEGIARTAAEHGLNGVLLSAGFDALDLKPPDYFHRLQRLKASCDQLRVEIVPLAFSVGYGGGVLAHDKNLAAGLPVRGALFVAGDEEARFLPDPLVNLANGDFERRTGNLPAEFAVHGAQAALDNGVFHSGKASVRFENFGASARGEVFLSQTLRVHPYHCYRLRCWVKTEGAAPRDLFHLWAVAPDGRDLAYMEPWLPATTSWQELVWEFNSWYAERVEFRIGVSEGQKGKVWEMTFRWRKWDSPMCCVARGRR